MVASFARSCRAVTVMAGEQHRTGAGPRSEGCQQTTACTVVLMHEPRWSNSHWLSPEPDERVKRCIAMVSTS